MTRKRNNKRRVGARNNPRTTAITRVPFHALATITLSGVTGTNIAPIGPNSVTFFGGLAEIGDQFDLYRLESLRYRLHVMDPTDTTNQGFCYYPDADTQTQTVSQLAQSPLSVVQTPFCGVPSRWKRVPRAQLKGMLDWYKCTPDSGAAEFEHQGVLYSVGGLSDVTNVEIEGVMAFKNPVSSALQFERAIERAVQSGKVVRVASNSNSFCAPPGGGKQTKR